MSTEVSMKTWQVLTIGILIGLAIGAGILIIASEPRGVPVELVPVPTPTEIVIYISGGINKPGVYHILPGSRIEQAVIAAGGLTADADASRADLARLLTDGDQVYIPRQSDLKSSTLSGIMVNGLVSINLNTATIEELESIPGIGSVKAQSIISYRESHGPFLSLDDLINVPGIGKGLLEQIKPYLYIASQ